MKEEEKKNKKVSVDKTWKRIGKEIFRKKRKTGKVSGRGGRSETETEKREDGEERKEMMSSDETSKRRDGRG